VKSPRRLAALSALVLVLVLAAPALAQACEVCFSGPPRVRTAFFNATIFMSLLPLGMIGWGLWWLRRQLRGRLAGEFEDRD